MNTTESFITLATALFISLPAVLTGQESNGYIPPCMQSKEITVSSLTGEEIKSLTFMREEEKLARDLYQYFNERWSLIPFRNISGSEQNHMDALLYLIEKYEVKDPAKGKERGEFEDQALRKLYLELVARGDNSTEEALAAAALVEETDITDLQDALDMLVENGDMHRIYSNLLRASKNHLRAFVRLLGFRGVEYEPVLLSPEEYKAIMES